MTKTINDFYEEIKKLKTTYLPEAKIKEFYKRVDKVSLRILISEDFFIDVYSNIQSGRIDFTLIKHGIRIFGYDNAGGWHYHPLEDPDTHKRCDELSLQEMFRNISQIIKE